MHACVTYNHSEGVTGMQRDSNACGEETCMHMERHPCSAEGDTVMLRDIHSCAWTYIHAQRTCTLHKLRHACTGADVHVQWQTCMHKGKHSCKGQTCACTGKDIHGYGQTYMWTLTCFHAHVHTCSQRDILACTGADMYVH